MFKQLTKILFLVAAIFILTFVGNPFPDFRQESAPFARAAAPSGSVLDFDGGDYLRLADTAVLDQGNRLTLSIWAKPDVAGDRYIIYRASAYYLKLTSSCAIEGAIYYSAAFQTITSSAIPCSGSAWTHIEMTYDKDGGGTDELKIYINGVLSATGDHSTAISDVATDLYIGSDSTPANYFDGKLDHFKLYQYARTSDEVKADYNNGLAAHLGKDNQRDDGLVGFWNMEEGKGQTVYDRSGNGNNGTLGASTSVAKDDPVFTSGYSSAGAGGTALKFDGVDDYVDMGSNSSLNVFGGDHTVELWAKWNMTSGHANSLITIGSFTNKSSITLGNKKVTTVSYALNGAWYLDAGSNLNDNKWHHIVAMKSGSTVYIYVDGVSKSYITGSAAVASYNRIGVGEYSKFSGSIDSVRIYNRALSADEIRQHYNQKKPILEWKFDEGSGTAVKDEGFNNYDGTLHE